MKMNNTLIRYAGISYLVVIIAGVFGMVYVPAVMFDWEKPIQSIVNLEEKAILFRLGITGCLLSFMAFVALSALLYRLFSDVEKLPALLLLCVGVLGSSAFLANTLNYVEIATLMNESPEHTEAIAREILFLSSKFTNGFTLIQVVTGVWLTLFGILSYRNKVIPGIISLLLIVAGVLNYILGFVLKFVLGLDDIPFLLSLPGTLGEFSACLWMVFYGVLWERGEIKII